MRIRPIGAADVLHAWRQDANDLERAARQRDGLADDRRVGPETPRPETVRQDRHGVAAGGFIASGEVAAGHHPVTEQLEKPGRHTHPAQTLRPVAAELQVVAFVGGHFPGKGPAWWLIVRLAVLGHFRKP